MNDQVSGKVAVDLAFVAYGAGRKVGVAEASPPVRREAIWTTQAGAVCISYPEPMPIWEVDFLEEFAALWLRGVRRRAEAADEALQQSAAPQSEPQASTAAPATDAPQPPTQDDAGGGG